MIDENQRRVDDYSYKNKAEYSKKTNWYYRPKRMTMVISDSKLESDVQD